MSKWLTKASQQLLPQLAGVSAEQKLRECTTDYPWYPLGWLLLAGEAGTEDAKQKAALWIPDEHRLHNLLSPAQPSDWLRQQLEDLRNGGLGVQEPAAEALPTPEAEAPAKMDAIVAPQPAETVGSAFSAAKMDWSVSEEENEADDTDAEETAEDDGVKLPEIKMPGLNLQQSKGLDALFQPYHTVDYFASQGIKLELPKQAATRFDRQLMTFTQWLKVMKKTNFEPPTHDRTDPLVDAQATASVEEKEVYTEAMAEVLEKQGLFEKALEVYEKLVLLHPEKSIFFATRIQELKDLKAKQ